MQAAVAQDPWENDEEFQSFVNLTTDITAGMFIPYWECFDGCTDAEFGLETAGIIPFARVGKIWTQTKKFSSVQNAFDHWKRHRGEFPGLQNAKQYVEATASFLQSPPAGTLTKVRSTGDVLRYHPGSNTFGVMDKSGIPRTMFRPKDGLEYWNKQN